MPFCKLKSLMNLLNTFNVFVSATNELTVFRIVWNFESIPSGSVHLWFQT
jgi:hypothetical protein